ncbi:MAG: chemotaxis response regulator protein-glutamate methylesterase [bacterium]|nr:chemotaxis response regulator protein-glutamate methylesterase [bacterium]
MPYKVLVVDDSALMRAELSKIIEQDPDLEVVSTAINGKFALDKIKQFDPDVVTLDVNMPQMDGLECLKRIMADCPRPVVMISSLTQEGAEETIEALQLGAVDFVAKPSGSISRDIDTQGRAIREKIKAAASARGRNTFIRRQPSRPKPMAVPKPRPMAPLTPVGQAPKGALGPAPKGPQGVVVGIGVSTGGPKTLMSLLPEIPANFPGSIVIAQHMPEKFTKSFAERLNNICGMRVKEAEEGEVIEAGCIYIAPGGKHMRLDHRNHKLLMVRILDDVPGKIYRPSVDVLFESLSEALGNRWVGVMLTGMGADGAAALTAHHKAGGHSIAESEESCVVFGMPGRVVEMGGAEFILDEDKIAEKVIQLVGELV